MEYLSNEVTFEACVRVMGCCGLRKEDEVGDGGRQIHYQRPPCHTLRRKRSHENELHSQGGMTRSIRETHVARGLSRDHCLERVI